MVIHIVVFHHQVDREHHPRFEPGARETVEILNIIFQIFSNQSQFLRVFFPTLSRFLPTSESDKRGLRVLDFMRQQIKEHEAKLDENAPHDFIDVYLAKIR